MPYILGHVSPVSCAGARDNKPPAMRVRVEGYTQKLSLLTQYKLFKLYCKQERRVYGK